MSKEINLASNLVPFSQVSDRFVPNGYKGEYEFRKKLEMIATVTMFASFRLSQEEK